MVYKISLCLVAVIHVQLVIGSLRSKLESETGLDVETITFNNWASNVRHTEVTKIKPETQSHVMTTVMVARQRETRVRAAGSWHSFSDLYPDDETILVDMSNYRVNEDDRMYIAYASYYRQYTTATVNPSVSMREFLVFLGSEGVTLPNYPSVDASSVAGVIATASHGYTADEGSLSTNLVNIQLINGEGEFREFDVDTNPDQFDMFRSHLGLCGIIIRMTFRVEPYQLMNRIGNISYPLYNIMYNTTNLNSLINNKHSFLATWQLLSSRSDSDLADMATNGGITSDYNPEEDLMDLVIYEVVEEGTSETGRLAETLEFVPRNFTLGDDHISEATEQFAFYTDIATMEEADETNYPIHVELAISINRNTFNGLTQALDILLDEIRNYATSHSSMPVHNIQLGFWHHNSACLLCHSNIADSSVNSRRRGPLILMVNFQFLESDENDFLDLLETIYTSWQDSNINTLPHLGKYIPSFMVDDVVSMMRPKIDEFRQLRLESGLDSIDIFTNDFLDEIIFYDLDRPSSGRLQSAGVKLRPSSCFVTFVLVTILFVFSVLI